MMNSLNPKTGNPYHFYVKHGDRKPQRYVVWAPTPESAEDYLKKEYPKAKIWRCKHGI